MGQQKQKDKLVYFLEILPVYVKGYMEERKLVDLNGFLKKITNMSAIDKTYVSSWEQWKELKDWVWDKEIHLKNGLISRPRGCMYYPEYGEKEVTEWLENVRKSNMEHYGWTYEEALENSDIPFWNTPTYVDIWLIRNCPIEWVQDRLKSQYGGGWSKEAFTNQDNSYEAIKNGTSEYDTWQRNGLGKNFKYKVIKKPNWHYIHRFRYIDRNGKKQMYKDDGNNWWSIHVTDIKHPYDSHEHISWWANEDFNYWTCHEEALPYTSNIMNIKGKMPSLKAIIRMIQNWDLPDGTKVEFNSFRFRFGWTIIVKKK